MKSAPDAALHQPILKNASDAAVNNNAAKTNARVESFGRMKNLSVTDHMSSTTAAQAIGHQKATLPME